MIYGSIEEIKVEDDDVIAYRRKLDDMVIDCYFSFSNFEVELEKKEDYEVIFNNLNSVDLNDGIKLKPLQAVLLKVR